jgi:hypothetical protein
MGMDTKSLLGKQVYYPDGDGGMKDKGIVTNCYHQPARDLTRKDNPLTFLSDDELPDSAGNYPKKKTSPKTLYRVQFKGYVYITEPQYLILADTEK